MLAQNDFESGNGGLVAHYLKECQPNLRGWEHRYLAARTGARQTLMGHTRSVTSVACSPDDTLIATGGWDNSTIVWNSQSGKVAFTLVGHRGEVMSVAFSSDGRRIVTGSTDTTARVWDASTGQELQAYKGHNGMVRAVAFSPDDRYIAVGSGESSRPGELTIWNAQTNERHRVLNKLSDAVRSLAWSPDGKQIVTGSGFLVSVWDAETGLERMSLRHGGVLGGIWCVAYSPDGSRIASGAEDGKAKVWDAKTGLELHSLNGHTAGVASVAFSPDGRQLVTGAWDNTVRAWETERGEELLVIKGHADWVLGVAFSADGRRIVSGSVDTTAKVWDAQNGQNVTAIKCAPIGGIASVAFSPDSKCIVVAGEKRTGKLQEDYVANIWDVETGKELIALRGHTDFVHSVAFSPDGLRIATSSRDKTVREWDAATGQQLRVLEGHTSPITYSPDSAILATGYEDNFLKLLDTKTGQVIRSLDVHARRLRSVVFSPDGTRIVTASDDAIARSPTESGVARVWNTKTGEQLHVLDGVITNMFSTQTLAFSPDGQYILTVCRDNMAKVWKTATAQEFLVLKGHTSPLTSVAFSPDGQRVITGSFDKSAKLWELERGLEVFSFNGHPNEVTSVAFSPDGRCVVTGTWNTDNTLRLWRAETEADHAWPLPDAAERIRDHLDQADAAERENHLFAAAFRLNRVLRDDPENVAARTQLAAIQHTIPFKIAFQKRDFALAASIWNEAIAQTQHLATIVERSTPTTLPAPQHWLLKGKASRSLHWMMRPKPSCGFRHSLG